MFKINLKQMLLAVLALLVSVFLYMNIELVEVSDNTSTLDKLADQRFLAMQKLLENRGVGAKQAKDYRILFSEQDDALVPTESDAIVLTDSEVAISQALSKAILAWVEQGGYLVIATTSSGSDAGLRANRLLSELGIGVQWLETNDDNKFETEDYLSPTEIDTDSENPIMVNLEKSYRITLPANQEVYYHAGDELGYTFVQIERGQGLITLMTEVEIWNNHQISEFDNVVLLTGMLSGIDTLYMMVPKERQHWFALLFSFAPYFLGIGGILLFTFLWRKAVRFGPTYHLPGKEHVVFSQHIEAAGQYYWTHQQQYVLLDSVRAVILQALIRRWPTVALSDLEKQIHLLSELSGWQTETIKELVFGHEPLNEGAFTKRIIGLQKLRNML
jgi:hypothetical protein